MIAFIAANPLILLFLVAAVGYPLGLIKISGSSLGVAAVLFAGLAFGAVDPSLKLPEIIYQFGLALFVYTIGLSSGPGFFRALRRRGVRDSLFVAVMLIAAACAAYGFARAFHLPRTQAAGLFAGSLTSTPALAAVLESLKSITPESLRDTVLAEPVVGYSIAYPIGVIGMLLAIVIAQRAFKPDYAAEARLLRDLGGTSEAIVNRTIRVTTPLSNRGLLATLYHAPARRIIFARHLANDKIQLVTDQTRVEVDDLISVIGTEDDIETAARDLGEIVNDERINDRGTFDYRRIFVSNPAVAGRRIGSHNLQQQFGALVTRVRRGDIELLANADTVLELGDRVRVVALRDRMRDVSNFFGDSYRAISEIDILTFSLGLVIGLLIGQIPIPLPTGVFRLGIAGGPLLVSLVLGAVERSGPLVWTIPYSANLTLRQIGLVLFLAAIGTRAGYTFVSTLLSPSGLLLFGVGALITLATAGLTLFVGHKILKIPMSLLIGMLSGLQTHPAILAFAAQQTRNELPNIGYATVYPVAMICKIVLAQLLLTVL